MKLSIFFFTILFSFICKAEDAPGYKDACATYQRAVEGVGFGILNITPGGHKVNDLGQAIGRNVTYDSWNETMKSWCSLRKDTSLLQGASFNQKGISSLCYSKCNNKLLTAQNITEPVRNYLMEVCKKNCDESSIRFDSYAKGFAAGKETCLVGGMKSKSGKISEPDQSMGSR